MIEDLVGKTVVIRLNTFGDLSDKITGKVMRVAEPWIEIATKKDIEYVCTYAIKRIIVRTP